MADEAEVRRLAEIEAIAKKKIAEESEIKRLADMAEAKR